MPRPTDSHGFRVLASSRAARTRYEAVDTQADGRRAALVVRAVDAHAGLIVGNVVEDDLLPVGRALPAALRHVLGGAAAAAVTLAWPRCIDPQMNFATLSALQGGP